MRINFVGTGSAFTMKNFQTNIILEHNDKRLLVDAGTDIRFALRDAKLSYKDVNALYLTHLHADHIGGVEYLAFTTYFDPSITDKITLYGNNDLIRDAWTHVLQGGLRSVQGKVTNLHDFFDVQMVKKNGNFIWENHSFRIVQSVHIMDGYSIVNSFGLMVETPDHIKIYITGDTQFNPNQIIDFYKEADYIIQDCETAPYMSKVHAHYEELKTLPADIKSKMMLVHYQDNVLDDEGMVKEEWVKKTIEDGFKFGLINKNNIVTIGS